MRTQSLTAQFHYLKALTDQTPGAPSLTTALARLGAWRLRCLAGRGTYVPAWSHETSIYCPAEWRGNAKLSYVMRGAIEPDLAIALAMVEPGALVVDVGAHYGAFSLPLGRAVGPDGVVLALEPNPHARSVLARGIAVNGLENIRLLPYAASDAEGSALLHLAADPSRSSLHGSTQPGEVAAVELRPLDSMLADRSQPVRLLKVDVEGHEAHVFRGAAEILSNDRPIIVFEDLGNGGRRDLEPHAIDLLRDLGYEIREFWRGSWWAVTGFHHRSKNLWAFPGPDP